MTTRRRGLSLVETVFSMFLLAGIMLVIVNLFHASLRYQVRVENQGKMTMLATRTLNDARAFAQTPVNFASGLSYYNGRTWTEPDMPEFSIRTDTVTTGRTIYSPCETLEVPWTTTGQARRLDHSVVPLRVTVTHASESISLLGYIAEPVREPNTDLEISPLTVPDVPAGGTFTLTVTARDTGGVPIEDLFYKWHVDSESGNATIVDTSPRDGRSVTIQHEYDGEPVPGTIRVNVYARYKGQYLSASLGPINLLP